MGMIEDKVTCIEGSSGAERCSADEKKRFVETVSYVQLKKKEHYGAMCDAFRSAPGQEDGRIIYLSRA